MKGMLVSLITLTMVAVLFLLWLSTTKASMYFENALSDSYLHSYPGFLGDDLFYDVNSIAGPQIILDKDNYTRLFINETLPKSNISSKLQNYASFVRNIASNQSNASLELDVSGIADGTTELTLMQDYLYIHNWSSGEVNSIHFQKIDSDSDVNTYYINVTVPAYRKSLNDFAWIEEGDMNATLIYTDYNGTVTTHGSLSSAATNDFRLEYEPNGKLEIRLGRKVNSGELYLKATNATVTVTLIAVLPLKDNSAMQYNATFNYSHADVRRDSYVMR
ncbi:MAG: hypothetical protein ABII22_01485 [Candidatus Micrarchaeota archaeon]